MTKEEMPSDARRGTLETFSPERSVVDQMVIDGLAQAIKIGRIEQEFGENLIKTYLANRESP